MDIIEKFQAEFGNPNKLDWFARKCDGCGNGMNSGYLIDGCYTTCSEKCCRKVVGDKNFNDAMKEWEEDGDSDYIYWTDWEDLLSEVECEDGYYNGKGKFIECTVAEAKKILLKSDYFSNWEGCPAWEHLEERA